MRVFFLLILCTIPKTILAQPDVDTTFTWQGYARTGVARIQRYPNPASEERPHTFVVKEVAENRGPTIVQDLTFLVEQIGRSYNIDPTAVYWILHWGDFSFEGAESTKKELFLRATFRRNKNLQLSSPQWRVIEKVEVEELTDRRFY